jgi:hypothetical protein
MERKRAEDALASEERFRVTSNRVDRHGDDLTDQGAYLRARTPFDLARPNGSSDSNA